MTGAIASSRKAVSCTDAEGVIMTCVRHALPLRICRHDALRQAAMVTAAAAAAAAEVDAGRKNARTALNFLAPVLKTYTYSFYLFQNPHPFFPHHQNQNLHLPHDDH